MLQELVSRFSKPGDLFVHLFTGTLSEAVACFTVLRHQMLQKCGSCPNCMCLAKRILLRQSGKTATSTGTVVGLSTEGPEAAEVTASPVTETARANRLYSLPEGLLLYHCLSPNVPE